MGNKNDKNRMTVQSPPIPLKNRCLKYEKLNIPLNYN